MFDIFNDPNSMNRSIVILDNQIWHLSYLCKDDKSTSN